MEDHLDLCGEGCRKSITLDAEPVRNGIMVVEDVPLDMAVVILPQLNELLRQVFSVSGGTSEFAAFCCDNSALLLFLVQAGTK